jgi:uncharacterized protein with PQ loop repeat
MTFLLVVLSAVCLSGCEGLRIDSATLFFPGLLRSELFGFLAGLGTTFAGLPDLLKMLKRRSSQGMNPTMAGLTGTFQILWVYYGLLIVSRPVIAWNLIGVCINLLSVAAYFRFAREAK